MTTKRPINCDQVAWMLDAFSRYLPPSPHPAVSRAREMQKYALLYEIMEVANLHFEDDAAQQNGTPHEARAFRWPSKQVEAFNAQRQRDSLQRDGAIPPHGEASGVIGGGMTLAGGDAQARELGQLMREQYGVKAPTPFA